MLIATFAAGAACDSWISVTPEGNAAVKETTLAQAPRLAVLGYDQIGIELTVNTPSVELLPHQTEGGQFIVVTWPDAGLLRRDRRTSPAGRSAAVHCSA